MATWKGAPHTDLSGVSTALTHEQLVCCTVAAALAAGCTVVLKPSEVTPITANLFGQLCMDVKLPAGVLNIVRASPRRLCLWC